MNPRALVAGSARVAWRRAVTDRWLLLGLVLIIAITSFLGLTGPRLIAQASDEAARAAVTDAGSSAGLIVSVGNKIGTVAASDRDESIASKTRGRSTDIQVGLPPRVRAITGTPTAVQLSNRLTVKRGTSGAVARLAWLWRDGEVGVTWVDGHAPQLSPLPVDPTTTETTDDDEIQQVRLVEVGLTQANADVLHVAVGDHLAVNGATRGLVEAVVSGIFAPDDETDPLWGTVPGLLDPTPVGAPGVLVPTIGMLLSDESLSDAAFALQRAALTVQYEFAADPTSLTANDVESLRTETNAIVANPTPLTLAGGVPPTVTTQLPAVLADYQARLRGAMAQASVMFVGLVTVGALALLLAARLINARRASLLSAERARGSSVAAVAFRLTLESIPVAAVGVALGALGSGAVSGSAAWVWWPGIVVAVVAVAAVPIGGARVAARSWTGERVPANRKDRERLAGRRRVRRTVAELAVVALTAAATVATRGRGLQQTQTQDVDLLLAATPVLLAGSVTIVVLRLFPWVLRLATRLAARRRGVIPLVSMARATRTANLGLPLLALTVALGLVVFSGLTAASTHRGEERGAMETVGADVRLDGFVAPDVLAALSSSDGVTAIAEGTRRPQSTFNGDPSFKVTVLSVDAAEYGTILARYDPDAAAQLAVLGSESGSDAAPRALVSPNLAGEVSRHGARVFIGGETVQLDVVGTTDVALPGERLVVVDRETLAAITPDDLEPEQIWIGGDGASAAVAAAVADRRLGGVTVLDRAVLLDNVRTSPLVRSVVSLLVVASVVLALYAAVALVLTVVATATDRGRTLSSLRTLGLDRGATWRITAAELAPLTTASVLTGAAIGLGVPLLLTESLGLNALTGERGSTSVVITAAPFLLAVGASLAALVVSVLSESLVRRRENLGQILRVGER